jgi:hypothetical protein
MNCARGDTRIPAGAFALTGQIAQSVHAGR